MAAESQDWQPAGSPARSRRESRWAPWTAWTQVGGTDTVHFCCAGHRCTDRDLVRRVGGDRRRRRPRARTTYRHSWSSKPQKRAAKLILTVRDDEPIPDSIRIEIWKAAPFQQNPCAGTVDRRHRGSAGRGTRRWTAKPSTAALENSLKKCALTPETSWKSAVARWRPESAGIWRWNANWTAAGSDRSDRPFHSSSLWKAVADVLDVLRGRTTALTALTEIADAEGRRRAETRNLITVGDTGTSCGCVAHPL